MKLAFWKRKTDVDREQTRREREAAEARLAHATEHVIVPLSRLRDENHIVPLLDRLIQRKARELRGQ